MCMYVYIKNALLMYIEHWKRKYLLFNLDIVEKLWLEYFVDLTFKREDVQNIQKINKYS